MYGETIFSKIYSETRVNCMRAWRLYTVFVALVCLKRKSCPASLDLKDWFAYFKRNMQPVCKLPALSSSDGRLPKVDSASIDDNIGSISRLSELFRAFLLSGLYVVIWVSFEYRLSKNTICLEPKLFVDERCPLREIVASRCGWFMASVRTYYWSDVKNIICLEGVFLFRKPTVLVWKL